MSVAVAPFLKPGEKYRVLRPENLYGQPVVEGTCAGAEVSLPVQSEFAAYVLVK